VPTEEVTKRDVRRKLPTDIPRDVHARKAPDDAGAPRKATTGAGTTERAARHAKPICPLGCPAWRQLPVVPDMRARSATHTP
jgi:hypothetical protein